MAHENNPLYSCTHSSSEDTLLRGSSPWEVKESGGMTIASPIDQCIFVQRATRRRETFAIQHSPPLSSGIISFFHDWVKWLYLGFSDTWHRTWRVVSDIGTHLGGIGTHWADIVEASMRPCGDNYVRHRRGESLIGKLEGYLFLPTTICQQRDDLGVCKRETISSYNLEGLKSSNYLLLRPLSLTFPVWYFC